MATRGQKKFPGAGDNPAPVPMGPPVRLGLASPILVLLVSLALTGVATVVLSRSVDEVERLQFEEAVSTVHRSITERLTAYGDALVAGAALFAAVEGPIDVGAFRRFEERFAPHVRHAGMQGYGFTETVYLSEKDAFERAHTEPGRTFRIWPEGERAVYQPVTYLFPEDERNRASTGYDMFSEPTRARAMTRARDTGMLAMTGRVTLVQEIDRDVQPGFLMYVPVYDWDGSVDTVEHRRLSLRGFVYAPFRAHDMFDSVEEARESPLVAFRVVDGDSPGENQLFASKSAEFTDAEPDRLITRALEVGGRKWTLQYTPTGRLGELSHQEAVPAVAILGVLASLGVFVLALRENRARMRTVTALVQRQRSEEELREANRAKDEFLAMLGHELRNPLAATRAALEVMRSTGTIEGEAARALEAAERQVGRQKDLVDDLLDVSRVSRGVIELRKRTVDLRSIVADAVASLQRRAQDNHLTLTYQGDEAALPVLADPTRIDQVVQNLVTNAIKYTPRDGSIAVTARREGERAVVRVKDDGIGIEAPAIDRIFDLFAQVDTSIERSRGGLGIGLTLTRRLVESHGGTVRAESAGRHRGSEFIVELPLGNEDELEPSSPSLLALPDEPSDRLQVLLVEDNEDVRVLTERLIRRWGHDVVSAETGSAGLDLALTQHPDVALIDIGLPELDGFEVARRIRERENGHHMLLVAVTGYGRAEDRRESEQAGFDRHLTKPVEPIELRKLLSDAARQAAPR